VASTASPASPRASASWAPEAAKLIHEAMLAFNERNGQKCLTLIEQAERIEPSTSGVIYQARASCEMLVGKCEQGEQRMRAAGAPEAAIEGARMVYCSANDTSNASREQRIYRVASQATSPPHSVARCRQLLSQLEQAVAERGSPAPTPGTVGSARQRLALCFALAGDCAQARAVAASLFPEPDREQRVESWLVSAIPACAGTR
jgi:hypothetical protein